MGGGHIDIFKMVREACEIWHDLTGGEVIWTFELAVRPLDIFERMEIANLTGAMFRG